MTGYGRCMLALDDLSPTGAMAEGVSVFVQRIYHALTTERGTMWTDPEFGFGLSDLTLSAMPTNGLPALGDEIAAFIEDDERCASATVTISGTSGQVEMSISVIGKRQDMSFSFVGTLAELRSAIIARGEADAA